MNKRWAWWCALVLVGATAAMLTRTMRAKDDSQAIVIVDDVQAKKGDGSSPISRLEQPDHNERTDVPNSPESAPVHRRSIANILSEYWGDEWTTVAKQAAESGLDLSRTIQPPPPWEKVAAEFEGTFALSDAQYQALKNRYLWPSSTTKEYIDEHFQVEEADLTEELLGDIESVALVYQPDLARGVEDFRHIANEALKTLWREQRFRKGPLFLPPTSADQRVVLAANHIIHSWSVSCCIDRDEFPELDAKQKELEHKKIERTDAIQGLLSSKH